MTSSTACGFLLPSRLSIAPKIRRCLALAAGHLRPDRLGFLELAVPGIELGQPGRALVAGGQLVELLLIPGGALEVAFFLGQLRELLEQLGVAGVGGQQPLELGAGAAEIARGGVGLGHADRDVACRRLAAARRVSRSWCWSRVKSRSNWLRWR